MVTDDRLADFRFTSIAQSPCIGLDAVDTLFSHTRHTSPTVKWRKKNLNVKFHKSLKRVKYEQKFKLEYRDEFKRISKSAFCDTFAFCNVKMLTISPYY